MSLARSMDTVIVLDRLRETGLSSLSRSGMASATIVAKPHHRRFYRNPVKHPGRDSEARRLIGRPKSVGWHPRHVVLLWVRHFATEWQ